MYRVLCLEIPTASSFFHNYCQQSPLRIVIKLLQLLNNLFHAGSHFWIIFNTPQYQLSKLLVRYQSRLFLPLFRFWQFPGAHFTEENSKTVNINLRKQNKLPELSTSSVLFGICSCYATKGHETFTCPISLLRVGT